MNKDVMKRKNMEEANIQLQKRIEEEKNNIKPTAPKNTTRKEYLSDRLMNQLKYGK